MSNEIEVTAAQIAADLAAAEAAAIPGVPQTEGKEVTPPTEEAPKEETKEEAKASSEVPSANTVFKVHIFDLHTGGFAEFAFPTMSAAIDAYKKVVAQARADQPYIVLDDYNWLATIKFKGGKVRVLGITNGEKVYGHTGGMRKREAQKDAQFQVPALS